MPILSRKNRIVRKRTPIINQNIRQYIRGGVIILIVVGILFGVHYVTSLTSLQIKHISVTGGETVSHTLVRETAWKALDGSYAKIVPRTFSYGYPEDDIYTLLHNIPRVKDVYIEKVSRESLTISFTEYYPHALWCDGLSETATCLFMDAGAFGYGDAPTVRGASFIQYVDEGASPHKHTQSPFADRMRQTELFQTQLQEVLSSTIRAVLYTTYGDVLYYLTNGGEIRTKEDDDLSYVVSQISSLISHKKYAHLATEPFVHIDLRFGSKVYVKEKEIEAEIPVEESTIPATSSVATTTE